MRAMLQGKRFLGGVGTHILLFFQAEDGIRDVAVTGVQTCALPISSTGASSLARVEPFSSRCRSRENFTASAVIGVPSLNFTPGRSLMVTVRPPSLIVGRSEERRVGEEGRSRGAPDHLKKKKKKCRVAILMNKEYARLMKCLSVCDVLLSNDDDVTSIQCTSVMDDGRLCVESHESGDIYTL